MRSDIDLDQSGLSYVFRLSRTFSVNKMFANIQRQTDPLSGDKRGGRVLSSDYKAWREMAGREMMQQGRRPRVRAPVRVSVLVGTTYRIGETVKPIPEKFDADNTLKAICDLIVAMGVVPDDKWRCIPEHSLTISPVHTGAVITVTPLGYHLTGEGLNVRRGIHD